MTEKDINEKKIQDYREIINDIDQKILDLLNQTLKRIKFNFPGILI